MKEPEPVPESLGGIEEIVKAAMRENVHLGLYNGFTIAQWIERAESAEASLVSERLAFQRSILALRVQLERKS